MTAAMDSPDRNLIMPSSDIQGSPFFHFLCSLSPIKPVKIGHGTQTFSELSFPPPPAVFVSPKLENQRDSARSKRRILAGGTQMLCDVEEKSEVHDVVGSSSELVSDVEKNSLSWRQPTNGHRQIAVAPGNHSITPFGGSEATKVSKDGSSKPEIKVSQCSSGGTVDCKLDYLVTTQNSSVAHVKESPGQEITGTCMVAYDNVKAGEGSSEETYAAYSSFHGNQVKMVDQCTQSISCPNLPDKDKESLFLSSNDLEKMAASLSLPVESLSKLLASMSGTADIDNQIAGIELDFPQASNEPSTLQGGEEMKAENINHGTKATTMGVRRRCLDFETLETQQKALDSLPTLNMVDLSSDNPSCSAFSSNLKAQRESASSENDAVQNSSSESQNSNAWDHGMHTLSNLHVLPQYTRMPNPSTATYPPSQQNPIINSQISGPRFSLQAKPICMGLLNTGFGCSLPSMTHSRIENLQGITGDVLPYSARLLPSSGLQGSSLENEQNHLQNRDYMQDEYSSSLDQELLLSLVNRTRMIQHDLLIANTAAHTRMARPSTFYPSVGLGVNLTEENTFSSELESRHLSYMDKSVILPETSHQSESDHQEESTLSPRSPRKKRKLLTQTGDNTGESCKTCKCKKSKCLKLYCECFAAGVYCIDICNCLDCYNKPEYEETVLGTRQQIESRNPLAFLPKIIRASDTSPTVGEESGDTPASARHKRGCNCKKSQCLKKYCECYQAGVGCADGCRCEGCKNIYGRNEGSGDVEDKDHQNAISEIKITRNDELTEIDLTHSPEHLNDQQSRDICPITSYLENAGQPRSDVELVSSERLNSLLEHPASTLSVQSPSRLLELLEETENFGQANLPPYQTACTYHQPSPRWNRQTEIYTLTPPAQPLQRLAPLLTDVLLNKRSACHSLWQTHDNSSSNVGSYVSGLTNSETQSSLIHQQMVPLNFSPDTSQFETPENALTLPATPLFSTTYASRPNYDYEELSESQSHQSVWFADEDDSPSVLREVNNFCAPNIITKTRSPQQKRIFSYQRSTGLRNSLSPGLCSRNGRKFILHALPSSGYSEKPRDNV